MMRNVSCRILLVLNILPLLIVVNCATPNQNIGDQIYLGQDYQKAAAIYENYLKKNDDIENEESYLFRLGMSYYISGKKAEGEAQRNRREMALKTFDKLLSKYPNCICRAQVVTLIELDQTLEEKTQHIEKLQEMLEYQKGQSKKCLEENDGLEQEIVKQISEIKTHEETLDKAEKNRENLTQELRRYQRQIEKQEKRIRRLIRELSELKRIDMQPSP